MECRICGACCIAISISSKIPQMENGKPAGVRCIHLDENNLCKIFLSPERPNVCFDFKPDVLFCGNSREEAMEIITRIENSMK